MSVRVFGVVAVLAAPAVAQPPGFGPPPGLMGGGTRPLVKEFDADGNGRLDAGERAKAWAALKDRPAPRRFGPPGGKGDRGPATGPGPKVDPATVPSFAGKPLYDPGVFRTLFLRFEADDWEKELEDFHGTDVEVPAVLTVDGRDYPGVGVHFRGMSSYMAVRAGQKRSLNLTADFTDGKQRVGGYKTLNLLNAHEDPSFLSSVLYSHLSRPHLAAPKANLVRVVVNGESWGVYASVQQFDRVFVKENFGTDAGARWKVRGSPGGGGGLEYSGDDPAGYKRRFEIKSKDDPKDWDALVRLCKTLNETPADRLEAALRPMLDLDGLLWFLALDVALINCDGYWARASDYSLYRDPKGVFHVVPHDMNEAFRPPTGPGIGGGMRFPTPRPGEVLPPPLAMMLNLTDAQRKQLADLQKEVDVTLDALLTPEQRKQVKELRDAAPPGGGFRPGGFGGPGGLGGPPGGPRGGGGTVDLDPLVGLTDARKPLRSKVLAVPALRAKYLAYVREIADKQLDWATLGPVVAGFRRQIEAEVRADTRKLEPTEAFLRATADDATAGGGRGMPLRAFADARRKYLLAYREPTEGAK